MTVQERFGLKGRTAVVIGGGGVLGGTMAQGLADAGADVAIVDLDPEKARAARDRIVKTGVRGLAVAADASSKADMERAESEIASAFGGADILINAPGVNSATPFLEIEESEWDRILNVNLKSMLFACQLFGRRMIERKRGGSIINISSASSGPPLSKVLTYGVSKAGVNSLTQFLAREWATQGVRVNAVLPGFFPAEQNRKILTPERTASIMGHTPMGRFGEAEELVGTVVWLASEKASSFVTGALIRVDGGFSAMTI
jgi:NAD(P)-dependent dehydrogenase (short-subunit alcohol dehydrogenase family)